MIINRINRSCLRLLILLLLYSFVCSCKNSPSLEEETDEYSIHLSIMLEELEHNDALSIEEAVNQSVGYTDDTLITTVIQYDTTGIEFYVEDKVSGIVYHVKDGEISTDEMSMAGYIRSQLNNISDHEYFDTEEKKEWYDNIKWLIYRNTFFCSEYCKSSYYKKINYPLLYSYFSKPGINEKEDTILLNLKPFIAHPEIYTPSWCLFDREVKFSPSTGEVFSIKFLHYSDNATHIDFSKNILTHKDWRENTIDSILKLELKKNHESMNQWFVQQARKRGYFD